MNIKNKNTKKKILKKQNGKGKKDGISNRGRKNTKKKKRKKDKLVPVKEQGIKVKI